MKEKYERNKVIINRIAKKHATDIAYLVRA